MTYSRPAKFIIALALPLAFAACGGGSDSDGATKQTTSQEVRTTTVGQELTDLKAALDQGAISQSEYEQQREKILERE